MFNFITLRNHQQKNFILFNIYKCRRFRKSHQKSEPELGMSAEWQHSKVSLQNVGQNRKTLKKAKINKILYLFSWVFGIIGQQCLYYFTSTSVADSENHIKKVNRRLACQQNDSIPRSVCKTSVKKEKLWKRRKSTKCYVHFHNFPESSASNFYIVSHVQVLQIPKIKSKKWTWPWNTNRMTTFQGQPAKP